MEWNRGSGSGRRKLRQRNGMEQKEPKRWVQGTKTRWQQGSKRKTAKARQRVGNEDKATKTRATEVNEKKTTKTRQRKQDNGSKTARANQRGQGNQGQDNENETAIEKKKGSYANRRHFVIGLKNLVIDGGAGTGDGDEKPLGRVGGCVQEVGK